jgi:hypothetical protein
MSLNPPRLLRYAAIITVGAFLLSGALRNAQHGVAYVAGNITWFTFLLGLLSVLILGTMVTVGTLRRRRTSQRPTA